MTQVERVYAICCPPEVAGDVISGENVQTVEGYSVLNLEVASFSSVRDIQRSHFVTTAAAAAYIRVSLKSRRTRFRDVRGNYFFANDF